MQRQVSIGLAIAGAAAAAAVAAAAPAPAPAGEAGFPEALYAELLMRHTRETADLAGTRVDYAALARSDDWARLRQALARATPPDRDDRPAALAFWIDAYNALAIDLVARHWPVASIRDVGSLLRPVWKRPAGTVGGRALSLDAIEHGILRPLGEPRIHAAIVCASLSCPSLAREPYRAEALDAQLDAALHRWLADPRKGARYDPASATLWLSAVFDWFEEDFARAGGVLAFVRPHLPDATRAAVEAAGDRLRLRHLDYDWSVNALAPE